MSDIFDRITYLVDKEANGIAEKFGEMIGVSGQAIRYISTLKRNKPKLEILTKIIQTFVWLDARWLLTGEGSPGIKDSSVDIVTPEFLLKRLEELAIENNELKKKLSENEKKQIHFKKDDHLMVAEPESELIVKKK